MSDAMLLAELARVKAFFQLRAIATVIGADPNSIETSTAALSPPRGAGRVGGGISHAASDTPTQPLKDALNSNSDVNCLIHGERNV